jgi:hypothetical protein
MPWSVVLACLVYVLEQFILPSINVTLSLVVTQMMLKAFNPFYLLRGGYSYFHRGLPLSRTSEVTQRTKPGRECKAEVGKAGSLPCPYAKEQSVPFALVSVL